MPIIDSYVNNKIDEALLAENAKRESEHESSGKLSASMLYQPLRFQVLKSLGAPRKPIEAYTLGKFKRGNDVEDWYVGQLEAMGVIVERQKKVEYRDAIGFVDALVDSDKMQFKNGIIPHEVKSVTNMKLKRIAKTEVDWHYKMQGCFYAMALGASHYAVDIVSAEDLRPTVYIFPTRELEDDVNKAISAYMKAMEDWKRDRTLPKFEANPKVAWTANIQYSMFEGEWATESDSWAVNQLEALGVLK